MNKKLDTIDISILNVLQNNSRISNAELSAKVNLSQTPCLRRLRNLEESGLIERYTIRLNHQMIGAIVSAFVFVKSTKIRQKTRLILNQQSLTCMKSPSAVF